MADTLVAIMKVNLPPSFPTAEELERLAVPGNIKRRAARYIGDTLTLDLAQLPANDIPVLAGIYRFLDELYQFCKPRLERSSEALDELAEFLVSSKYSTLAANVSRLSSALRAESTGTAVRKAYHDIRGGSLSALITHLDLIEIGQGEPDDLERVFVLCRDHRTIMRNAVRDLDPAGHEDDLELRLHSIALVREKWTNTNYRDLGANATIHVSCAFHGSIADCGMELAALDRVIYNLVHNAARYTADDHVHFIMAPIDESQDTHIRFVMINKVRPHHIEALVHQCGDDISVIFEGGFSTGGHGIGLRICADVVSHGYGLSSLREARERGYLGARLMGDCFVVWFHWPAQRAA